jgi:predicted transposase/invertase (TIGR01784 family)
LSEKISILEEEYKMPYVTSWERIAKKEGEKRGEEKGLVKTAKRMLEDNISIENIAKYTGLTEKEIKSLLN